MPALTLADLLSPQTRDTIRAALVTALTGAGFPVSSWAPSSAGGLENAAIDMTAGLLALRAGEIIPQLVAFRLLERSSGDELRYLARHFYKLEPRDAAKTRQNFALTATAAAGPEQFGPGDLVVVGPSGNHYRNVDPAAAVPGGTVPVVVEADQAGASFADAPGTLSLVSAPAGIGGTNAPASDYVEALTTGVSSGDVAVTLSAARPPDVVAPEIVRVRVKGTGEIGGATWDLSVDGGTTWGDQGAIVSSLDLPTVGITVTFTAGSAPPSFVDGDLFSFLRGHAVELQGRDAETDEDLKQRCRLKWTTLSDVPPRGLVEFWAKLASPEVERVLVSADPNTPGGVIVTLASSAGPASAGAALAVQAFIAARLFNKTLHGVGVGANSAEERVLVRSATPRPILASTTVAVPRARLRAVQTQAQANWDAYLRGVSIAGEVEIASFIQAIMDAGAVDLDEPNTFLNGGNTNLQLGPIDVAVASGALASTCAWQPV